MSEAWLLSLVSRYPHRTALARKLQNGAVFPRLQSLERRGLVKRYRDDYRLTRRGRDELAMARAVFRLVYTATGVRCAEEQISPAARYPATAASTVS